MVTNTLLTRIRGEYREMPGLRLTLAQACRLWNMDAVTCAAAMADLLDEQFLHRMQDGSYVAFSATRPSSAKAQLSSSRALGRPSKGAQA